MRITITKKNAIKAVMTEPLKGNDWFHDRNVSKCEVCAVGAVLRNSTNLKSFSYERAVVMAHRAVNFGHYSVSSSGYIYTDHQGDYEDALKNKNYMGALSMYFEYMYESFGYNGCINEKIKPKDLEVIRLALHDFIVAEFPNKFVVRG